MFIPVKLGSNSHHRDLLIHLTHTGCTGEVVVREPDVVYASIAGVGEGGTEII